MTDTQSLRRFQKKHDPGCDRRANNESEAKKNRCVCVGGGGGSRTAGSTGMNTKWRSAGIFVTELTNLFGTWLERLVGALGNASPYPCTLSLLAEQHHGGLWYLIYDNPHESLARCRRCIKPACLTQRLWRLDRYEKKGGKDDNYFPCFTWQSYLFLLWSFAGLLVGFLSEDWSDNTRLTPTIM